MIWFFRRGGEQLRYEIREAEDPKGYELIVRRPDGQETVERFPDTIRLLERSLDLQRQLVADGWTTDRSAQRSDWHWVIGSPSRSDDEDSRKLRF